MPAALHPRLAAALAEAKAAYPTQRVGQLIHNAIVFYDVNRFPSREAGAADHAVEIDSALFNITDEALHVALRAYAATNPNREKPITHADDA